MRLSCGCDDYCKLHGALARDMAVHDQPCRLCKHYSADGDRAGICKPNLMRVTADMHVTYWRIPDAALARHGLCFEPIVHETH